jgi:hypothetical protein
MYQSLPMFDKFGKIVTLSNDTEQMIDWQGKKI